MKTVIFIHGMYMNDKSWEGWINLFSEQGYKCHAPSWPFHQGEPRELRHHIPAGLGRLKLADLVAYYEKYIAELNISEKPILVGHSVGGLIAQLLAARGLAQKAVLISPAPPQGLVSFRLDFLRSNFPHVNPFAGLKPCRMTLKRFHYTFCNTMTLEETRAAYDRYVVHESRQVPRSATTSTAHIDYKKPHPPFLFLAADQDHLTPESLVKANARKYQRRSKSPVEVKVFPGRGHFICGQPGWQEVAAYTLTWLQK
jgi:pimeloyl-ACP methyl ester carboxylesterase